MDARRENEPTPMKNRTTVERKSERELVVTRTFNGPARIVFEAWTKPELFRRWWAPKSMGMSLRSCEMDVRVGGKYRLEFEPDAMAFFGTYLEVTPHSRLVWTNEEGGEGGPVTTVTFEEKGGKTLLVMHELYSSKEALDAAGTGAADAMVETFAQLDELLLTLGASVGSEQLPALPSGAGRENPTALDERRARGCKHPLATFERFEYATLHAEHCISRARASGEFLHHDGAQITRTEVRRAMSSFRRK